MLQASIQKNDNKAYWLVGIFSVIVFAAVVALGKIKLNVTLPFDVHIFAAINAAINTTVAMTLVCALIAIKSKKYELHKQLMMVALLLSVLFLVSYIAHHLFAGDTRYGGVGPIRYVYFFILITHIFLASVILPFILFTAYRALTAEWDLHKKLARYTFPLWLYVAITGPVVYLMIRSYY